MQKSTRYLLALSLALTSTALLATPLTQQGTASSATPTTTTVLSTTPPVATSTVLSSTLTQAAASSTSASTPPLPIYTMAAASDAGINPALGASAPQAALLTANDIGVDQAPEPTSALQKWLTQYSSALKAGAITLLLLSAFLAYSSRKQD